MAEVVLVEAAETFTHVAVRGKLDAAGVGEVDLKLTSHTVARRKPAVVDFGDVEFISSLGIGMLVTIAKSMRTHGVGVVILAARPQVVHALELTLVSTLIPIVATRGEALRTLGLS
jgi:anti-anti-sigma factor